MSGQSTLLTWQILLPLVAAAAVGFVRPTERAVARVMALTSVGLSMLLNVVVWLRFEIGATGMQLVHRLAWMPSLGVDYHLGVDGLGLLMVTLTSLVLWMAVAASDERTPPAGYALLLFLQSGLYGAFTALDFVHWFLFWELCLIPAYFLVKLYGGANRSAAAMQFFV